MAGIRQQKKGDHVQSIELSLNTKITFIQSRSPWRQKNYYGILKRQLKPNPIASFFYYGDNYELTQCYCKLYQL